jgi:hypothetical protein
VRDDRNCEIQSLSNTRKGSPKSGSKGRAKAAGGAESLAWASFCFRPTLRHGSSAPLCSAVSCCAAVSLTWLSAAKVLGTRKQLHLAMLDNYSIEITSGSRTLRRLPQPSDSSCQLRGDSLGSPLLDADISGRFQVAWNENSILRSFLPKPHARCEAH